MGRARREGGDGEGMMRTQREDSEEKESNGAHTGRGQEGKGWSMERRERGRDEALAGGGREGACNKWDAH
eukprot:1446444-Rhodomonas_salina.1